MFKKGIPTWNVLEGYADLNEKCFQSGPHINSLHLPNMRLASQKVRNISKGLQYIKTLQYTKKLEIYNRFENNSREPQSNNVLVLSMF